LSRATLSTHVLDISLGKPAAGVGVTLLTAAGEEVGEGMTDAQGRITQLVKDGVEPGEYQLVFALEDYFAERPHLCKVVTLDLEIRDAEHHHLPLLIGPYSISSYRGT
jgi:5-hydroxyisourate hydrolase